MFFEQSDKNLLKRLTLAAGANQNFMLADLEILQNIANFKKYSFSITEYKKKVIALFFGHHTIGLLYFCRISTFWQILKSLNMNSDFSPATTVSPQREPIPYICGLGARFGYERVERVFKPPRLKSQI